MTFCGLLNVTAWKEHDFFIYSNGKYMTYDVYDDTLRLIITDDPIIYSINLQLKSLMWVRFCMSGKIYKSFC